MKIAFLLYPTQKVNIREDSSFWIMLELCRRGHAVFYFTSDRLYRTHQGVHANLTHAKLSVQKGYSASPDLKKPLLLETMDCIFIRKEPPLDENYLYALQLLDSIRQKVFVLNDPAGIALNNEKMLSLLVKRHAPETIVTENIGLAKSFIRKLKKPVVVKPLNLKGGAGIFKTSAGDKNLSSILDAATATGHMKVMVQRYVDENGRGDKRILILNGEILGAFARRPNRHDFRANLTAGGTMQKASVTNGERRLVADLAPLLLKDGLYFAGIDLVGRFVTEINVTSPAGVPEIRHFNGTDPAKKVADFIEKRADG